MEIAMASKPGSKKINGLDRWSVENDLRALKDASAIKHDKKRKGAVKLLVREELGALSRIADGHTEGMGEGYSSHSDGSHNSNSKMSY